MALNTLLYNHHHHPSPELFSFCKTETLYLRQWLPIPFSPEPLATKILLSLSMNLTTLGASCKWTHTVIVLLWLAYFTLHNVLKIHPCCSMHDSVILWLQIVYICTNMMGISHMWLVNTWNVASVTKGLKLKFTFILMKVKLPHMTMATVLVSTALPNQYHLFSCFITDFYCYTILWFSSYPSFPHSTTITF